MSRPTLMRGLTLVVVFWFGCNEAPRDWAPAGFGVPIEIRLAWETQESCAPCARYVFLDEFGIERVWFTSKRPDALIPPSSVEGVLFWKREGPLWGISLSITEHAKAALEPTSKLAAERNADLLVALSNEPFGVFSPSTFDALGTEFIGSFAEPGRFEAILRLSGVSSGTIPEVSDESVTAACLAIAGADQPMRERCEARPSWAQLVEENRELAETGTYP